MRKFCPSPNRKKLPERNLRPQLTCVLNSKARESPILPTRFPSKFVRPNEKFRIVRLQRQELPTVAEPNVYTGLSCSTSLAYRASRYGRMVRFALMFDVSDPRTSKSRAGDAIVIISRCAGWPAVWPQYRRYLADLWGVSSMPLAPECFAHLRTRRFHFHSQANRLESTGPSTIGPCQPSRE